MRIVCRYAFTAILVSLTAIIGMSCDLNSSTSTIEQQTPDDYSRYEVDGFFRISYPPDWEPTQSYFEELEIYEMEYVLESGPKADSEEWQPIFLAGKATEESYYPILAVAIVKQPFPYLELDEVVEHEANRQRTNEPGWRELSRKKTTIGGLEACITKSRKDEPYGVLKSVEAYLVDRNYFWYVLCYAEESDFDEYEDTFDNIVRSFRPLIP